MNLTELVDNQWLSLDSPGIAGIRAKRLEVDNTGPVIVLEFASGAKLDFQQPSAASHFVCIGGAGQIRIRNTIVPLHKGALAIVPADVPCLISTHTQTMALILF